MDEPRTGPDEVSLRDLYLILRRHIGLIVLASVAVGAGTYAFVATRSPVYRAEALVAITRAPVTVQPEFGLAFRPEVDITFDTYSTLAYSRGVVERLRAAGAGREGMSLERLAGSATQPSGVLAVGHHVRHADPAAAAALASTWAQASVDTARALLHDNLQAAERVTREELQRARSALLAADDAVSAFREAQAGNADPQRLEGAHTRLAAVDARADELERLLRSREAEAAALAERVAAAPDGTATLTVLADAPEVPLALGAALATLEARVAGLRAELAAAEAQRDAGRAELAALSAAAARHDADLLRLIRTQEAAQRAYDAVLAMEPTVAYVAQLAPTGARVLSDAAVPGVPEPRRAGMTAAAAAVAAAVLAVVAVLVREAVSDPRRGARASAASAADEPAAHQPIG